MANEPGKKPEPDASGFSLPSLELPKLQLPWGLHQQKEPGSNLPEVPEKVWAQIRNELNLETFNILIIGRTGAGKSTLVNAVFEGELGNL